MDGEPVCPDIDEGSPPKEFQDWDRLLNSCDEPLKYQGRSVVIEGFVYDSHGLNTSDTFSLARFKISCCAVDAQPMLLTVAEQNWSSHFKANQWLRVEGTVQPKWVNEKLTAVIEPKDIKKISQPQNPYDFLNF
jgi:putative membrane protein